MAPSTDRTAFRQAVADVAAKAHEKLPECSGRIASAVKLVLLDEVTLHPDGTATVGSCTDPTRTYTVNGRCDCQDFDRAPGQLCKHRLAYGIARRAAELVPPAPEPQVLPPAPPAPLPEAPASCNVYVTIAGHKVQVTLRDTDESRMLARLQVLLNQYPAPEASSPQSHGEGWCSKHGVQMKRHENAKGVWFSHYVDGAHCKGR